MKILEISSKVATLKIIPEGQGNLSAKNAVVISDEAIEVIKAIIDANNGNYKDLTLRSAGALLSQVNSDYELRGFDEDIN